MLAACGSFGGTSESEPPPDGGQNGDAAVVEEAGLDAGSDSVVDGPVRRAKTCADFPGAIFCADFEGQAPFFGWDDKETSTGSQLLAAPDALRGGSVMRAVLGAGPPISSAQLGTPLTNTSAAIFVRAYIRFDASPADDDYHILLVLSQIEIGLEKGGLIVNAFGAQPFYEPASKAFPIGSWACLQWALDANTTTLSVDGEVVHSKMSPMATSQSIRVGIRHTSTTTAPTTVSFDDVVVSKQPIGCD